ncbi:MAG: hypothetical protein IT318_05500 [Anaerolineales bacterium]|nr:hypothetical protein [Anaerolineales bacterium]
MSQDSMAARLRRLLRQLAETQDEELSCSECFEQLSDYVDLELAGQPVAERLPALGQHLAQCGVCRDEYQVLRELARMAASGDLPEHRDPPGAPS